MLPTSLSSTTSWHGNDDDDNNNSPRPPSTVAGLQTGVDQVLTAEPYAQLCFNHQFNVIEGVELPQDIVLVDFDCLLDDVDNRNLVEDGGDDNDDFSTDTFSGGDSGHSRSSF